MFDNEDGRIFDINEKSSSKLSLSLDLLEEGGPLMIDKKYICIGDLFPEINID